MNQGEIPLDLLTVTGKQIADMIAGGTSRRIKRKVLIPYFTVSY